MDSGDSNKLFLYGDSTTDPSIPPTSLSNLHEQSIDESGNDKTVELVNLGDGEVGIIWQDGTSNLKAAKVTISGNPSTIQLSSIATDSTVLMTQGLLSATSNDGDSRDANIAYVDGTNLVYRNVTFASSASTAPTFESTTSANNVLTSTAVDSIGIAYDKESAPS